MAIAEVFTWAAVTISTTEKFITSGTTTSSPITTPGVYQFYLDTANIANGDEFEVAFSEKVVSGGTVFRVVIGHLLGAQPEMFVSPAFQIQNGGDFSCKKIAGTDRTFNASLRAVT